jgi:hypothetical protein
MPLQFCLSLLDGYQQLQLFLRHPFFRPCPVRWAWEASQIVAVPGINGRTDPSGEVEGLGVLFINWQPPHLRDVRMAVDGSKRLVVRRC